MTGFSATLAHSFGLNLVWGPGVVEIIAPSLSDTLATALLYWVIALPLGPVVVNSRVMAVRLSAVRSAYA